MRATEKTPMECKINSTILVQEKQAFLNHSTTLHSYVQQMLIRIYRLNASSPPLRLDFNSSEEKMKYLNSASLVSLALLLCAHAISTKPTRASRAANVSRLLFFRFRLRSIPVHDSAVGRSRIVPNKRHLRPLRRCELPDPNFSFSPGCVRDTPTPP